MYNSFYILTMSLCPAVSENGGFVANLRRDIAKHYHNTYVSRDFVLGATFTLIAFVITWARYGAIAALIELIVITLATRAGAFGTLTHVYVGHKNQYLMEGHVHTQLSVNRFLVSKDDWFFIKRVAFGPGRQILCTSPVTIPTAKQAGTIPVA